MKCVMCGEKSFSPDAPYFYISKKKALHLGCFSEMLWVSGDWADYDIWQKAIDDLLKTNKERIG